MDGNTEEEEYIPSCPHCGDKILELNAFVLEENKYTVEAVEYNKGSPALDYSTSRVVESSVKKTDFECPSCSKTIFTDRDGESQPRIVIDFLRGVRITHV